MSVRAADAGADPRWPIELATFVSGEFCESIFVTRERAAGILLETADALGIDLMAVLRGADNSMDEFNVARPFVQEAIKTLETADTENRVPA